MIDKITRFGGKWFPERQILIRSRGRILHLDLSSGLQVSASVLTVLGFAGACYMGIASSNRAAEREALAQELDSLKQQLAQIQTAAAQADSAEQAKFNDQVSQLQNDLQIVSAQNAQNRSMYEHTAQQLAQASKDSQKLVAEKGKLQKGMTELAQAKTASEKSIEVDRERLKLKVAELEKRLSKTGNEHVVSVAGVPGPQSEAEPSLPVSGKVAVDTSFSVEKLLAQLGVRQAAVGGPFVALNAKGGEAGQSAEAQRVLHMLPLTAPLEKYQFESPFGVRTDPFNGRQSVHTGIDLSAPYKTPVLATAPGTVVFAGYSAGYGKLVEIDHGNGIHTKYGHLNRITVNAGQKITKKTQIGLLGSTGRSTGPHVHYEVTVNGVAQDPEKFLAAGHSPGVVKAAF